MNLFRLSLLGAFELRRPDDRPARLPTRKTEALLAWLALAGPHPTRREQLAALLWGDATEAAALASLRQALSLINRACGEPVFLSEGRQVGLKIGRFVVDARLVEAAAVVDDPARLVEAATACRGELLAGLALAEPAFDDWLQAQRRHLNERALQLNLRLLQLPPPALPAETAIQAGLRLLDLDPLHEAGHRALMQCYAAQGRRAAALQQYQVCVNVLQRELGAEPEPATRQLYNDLLRQQLPASDGAAASRPARPALPTAVHEAPLVGRSAEWARLLQALEQSRAGNGTTLALLGEAGLGKTRLADELAARAAAAGIGVVVGRCHESQQLIPFAPWLEVLRAAGVAADPGLLHALGPAARADLADLLPELAASPPRRDADSAGPARQARLFDAVLRSWSLLCEGGPWLLVLEDLHWCDDVSLRLLAALSRRATNWPLLILASAREEELALADGLRRTLRELSLDAAPGNPRRLTLQPLSRADTATLVAALARPGSDGQAAARLADRVWAASEGNPFVVVEAVRALAIDAPAPAAGAGATLPERVRDLVAGQVDRLGADARRLLAVLAVAGRETPFAVLQRAAGLPEAAAAEALEELVRRHLARLVDDSFDVLHARARQAVLDGLLPPTRQALHLGLAEAIESLAGGGASPLRDRLAHHYAQTDRHDKAAGELSRLAWRAAHEGAHGQSLDLLDQALAHAACLPPSAAGVRRELLLQRARSLFFVGRFGELMTLLLPLQAEIDAAGDPLTAAAYYLRRGSTRSYLGEHAGAVADAQRALHEATACDDRATMGKAHFLLSLECFWAQPELGVAHGERAVGLLEGSPERWWTGQACWILGLNLSYRGRFEEGLDMQARAAALAEALGDRRLASYAAWTTGFIHTLAGNLALAIASCRRSLQLAVDPLNRMTTLGILSLALVEHGDADEALQRLAEAIPQAQQFRIPQMQGLFLGFRGHALALRGEPDAARAAAREGIAITHASNYLYGRGWGERVLARIERGGADPQAAEAMLRTALATFDGMGAPFEAARTRQELAQWLAVDGRVADARVLAEAARAMLATLPLPRQQLQARQLCDRLAALT